MWRSMPPCRVVSEVQTASSYLILISCQQAKVCREAQFGSTRQTDFGYMSQMVRVSHSIYASQSNSPLQQQDNRT